MSRIGKKSIALPSGVTLEVKENTVHVKGPKGELKLVLLPEVNVSVQEGKVLVARNEETGAGRARHGLTRALLANMVAGVAKGYEKRLEIIGVGYKAQAKGKSVTLLLGYSHPIEYKAPAGVEIQNDAENKQILVITGIDKQLVGQVAADIRTLRPPEPYKGKGIRYTDEYVRRKVGKAAVKASAA
jgi:large subunit ribosomal protein L6